MNINSNYCGDPSTNSFREYHLAIEQAIKELDWIEQNAEHVDPDMLRISDDDYARLCAALDKVIEKLMVICKYKAKEKGMSLEEYINS